MEYVKMFQTNYLTDFIGFKMIYYVAYFYPLYS